MPSEENLVMRVSVIILLGTWYMSAWLGWSGFMVDNKNCYDSMSLCCWTGTHLASACRWSRLLVLTQPREVRRAVFWVVCKSSQFEALTLGVQMGAA